jgi:hypothetical protein
LASFPTLKLAIIYFRMAPKKTAAKKPVAEKKAAKPKAKKPAAAKKLAAKSAKKATKSPKKGCLWFYSFLWFGCRLLFGFDYFSDLE